MNLFKRKLALITLVYWVLLLYIIAALVWWFVALNTQNTAMASMRLVEINKDDPHYTEKAAGIRDAERRKTAQYIGEGCTFLALTLLGAVFVYRAARKEIRVSQQQQNFMMAVTHELKTPIAVARLNLETLQKRKLDEETQNKLLSNTLHEANRLNTLCNNILLASQFDSGLYTSAKEEIDFSTLVNTCVRDYRSRFPQRTINAHIQSEVYINGEELLLQMLVNNLVENALKYSPKEMPVDVSLKSIDAKIELKIKDQGIGIPAEEKSKVFEKFYRSGDERTRKTKGTGLGLYLCRKIAEGHKGYISVTDNAPSGSIFAATFNVQ